jgi:hypothetical protein
MKEKIGLFSEEKGKRTSCTACDRSMTSSPRDFMHVLLSAVIFNQPDINGRYIYMTFSFYFSVREGKKKEAIIH